MNKLFLLLFLIPGFVFAQEKTDSVKLWKRGGVITANFSQVSLSNWSAGGNSSMSGVLMINSFADFKRDSLSWDNTIDLSYGFVNESDKDLVKSSDKIDLSSKLGYGIKNHWNYALLLNFKSQFAEGYNGDDRSEIISKFLAPAYINIGLGMDYKRENMSLFLSPANGKFTVVNDDVLSANGSFGVDPGKKFRSELGAMVKFEGKKEILKNVTAQTKLELFSNYFNNPQNIDVDWSVLINLKVNEYLSANIVTQLIYDDDITIVDPETGTGGPRVQFMEMFGVGLTLKY